MWDYEIDLEDDVHCSLSVPSAFRHHQKYLDVGKRVFFTPEWVGVLGYIPQPQLAKPVNISVNITSK